MSIKQSDIWQQLVQEYTKLQQIKLRDLFCERQDDNKNIQNKFSISYHNSKIQYDFSRQKITENTLSLLYKLLESTDFIQKRQGLFNGDRINISEHRSVGHIKARDLSDKDTIDCLSRMKIISDKIKSNKNNFTDVLSLGIGGSYLGPKMVLDALDPYHNNKIKIHFISNIDEYTLTKTLQKLDPKKTVCLINSKSFSTIETLTNAKLVIEWFAKKIDKQNIYSNHLIAITSKPEKSKEYGISQDNILEFSENIGGRFSIWSAVGLPVMIKIGFENFKSFLQGANNLDQHFYNTHPEQNIPIMMALIGIWNINFANTKNLAILPYSDLLSDFPSYLQQLEMESNGKILRTNGEFVDYATCPVIFGGVGCNNQHSFMQLIHQSFEIIPCDFILPLNKNKLLIDSCLAQSKSLMQGSLDLNPKTYLDKARFCPGEKPNSILFLEQLTPEILGSLIAIYEHKVFVQGIVWNIQSFDQFGVELGKEILSKYL